MPGGTLVTQVMYMNLVGNDHVASPGASNGVGAAILLNP
jgi:hypothetical protein